jgi:hypothetical protein
MSLSELQIRGAKIGIKPKKFSDDHRLMLRVSSTGAKRWALGYRFCGRQRLLGLGEWPAVSSAAARGEAAKARALLARGLDPATKAPKSASEVAAATFERWAAKARDTKERGGASLRP